MDVKIRINWTPNQWRRFCGQADVTPLVELASVVSDHMAMHIIDERLEALLAEADEAGLDTGSSKKPVAAGHGG